MIYGNKFLPKNVIENNIFTIESVVCEEYFNRINLLESCTDESSRPILEAQAQVLYEISFKDIIEKIKDVWRRFKAWVVDLWNKIFHNEEYRKKEYDKMSKEAHEAAEKWWNDVKNAAKESSGILKELELPAWTSEKGDDGLRYKIGSLGSGKDKKINLNIFTNRVYDFIKSYTEFADTNIKFKNIQPKGDDKEKFGEELEENKEKLIEFSEDLNNFHLVWSKIVEHSEFFTFTNMEDVYEENKESLTKVLNEYDHLVHNAFKDDSEECKQAKKEIDKYIASLDKNIQNIQRSLDEQKKKLEEIRKARSEYVKKYMASSYKMSEEEFKEFYHYKYWDNEKRKHVDISDEEAEKYPERYEKSNAYRPNYTYNQYLYNTAQGDKKNAQRLLNKGSTSNTYDIDDWNVSFRNNNVKEYKTMLQDIIKDTNSVISCLKKSTDAISGIEVKIIKGIERCTSEQAKVVKHFNEKYNTEEKEDNEI